MTITYDDFEKVDIRVGRVVEVQDFPEARKPAYKLTIDFGAEIGTKRSSAQITHLYTKEGMVGKLVCCVTNFPPKQIGHFFSECLTLGFANENDEITLISPGHEIPLGSKLC